MGILVTFHYSLLLVTTAVGIRYLVFVTLIVTQALRAERGSRVAAAVISFTTHSASPLPLLAPRAAAESGNYTRAQMDQKNCAITNSNPSFIAL